MYKRILVPLDGSQRAETILPHVEQLAQCFDATVILTRVLEPFFAMVTPYDSAPYFSERDERERQVEAESYLAEQVLALQGKGLQVEACLESGADIAHTILEMCERQECDLIAMASHGRSGIGRVIFGSVATGVLQGTDRPLLLIRSSGKANE